MFSLLKMKCIYNKWNEQKSVAMQKKNYTITQTLRKEFKFFIVSIINERLRVSSSMEMIY